MSTIDNFKHAIADSTDWAFSTTIIHISKSQWKEFKALCNKKEIQILDRIQAQLKEWATVSLPHTKDTKEYKNFIQQEVDSSAGFSLAYGNWVYYPWLGTVIHLLPKERFFTVRTNRNRDKITVDEQITLQKKRIGIIGLSVGHAAALLLAQEALCGEIRIADFDDISLSNLNRLQTSLTNLGVPKAVLTAREIAEIDPYLKVKVFPKGVTEENIDYFMLEEGKLDLIVEECDMFPMKIKIREVAKKNRIPVIMDTNDRGLLDIERFDKEPERPLLHGLIAGYTFDSTKTVTLKERIAIFSSFLGGKEKMSPELRLSLRKIGTKLVSYPQLASDVHLGAALIAHATRRILLGKLHHSGRYYVDLMQLIHDRSTLY